MWSNLARSYQKRAYIAWKTRKKITNVIKDTFKQSKTFEYHLPDNYYNKYTNNISNMNSIQLVIGGSLWLLILPFFFRCPPLLCLSLLKWCQFLIFLAFILNYLSSHFLLLTWLNHAPLPVWCQHSECWEWLEKNPVILIVLCICDRRTTYPWILCFSDQHILPLPYTNFIHFPFPQTSNSLPHIYVFNCQPFFLFLLNILSNPENFHSFHWHLHYLHQWLI